MASALKMRFSSNSSTASKTLSSPDFPISPSFDSPQLKSRFSVETLVIRTPRLASISHHRWFSSSPPNSPPAKIGQDRTSTIESKFNISSPTMVTRGSMDAERGEEEVLEFGLEMLRRSGGAYVVRTADDAFVSASTHNRTGSGESGKSQETSYPNSNTAPRPFTPAPPIPPRSGSRQRPQRSVSGPSPAPTRPPPPPPTRPLPPQPSCIPRSDLPPRSDSRNGFLPVALFAKQIATQVVGGAIPSCCTPSPSAPRRPSPTPATSELYAHVSPLTLPTRSVHSPTPPARPVESIAPFKALLLRSPSHAAVREKAQESILVSVKVGTTQFVTFAETLIRDGRGGKLGEFVKAAIDEAKLSVTERKEEMEIRIDSSDSVHPPSDVDVDDCESAVDPTHFNLSPFPSPFPFTRHDISSSDGEGEPYLSVLNRYSNQIIPAPCFFQKRSPPTKPDFSNPPLPTLPQKSQGEGLLVTFPLPHLRVTSVVPTMYTVTTSPRPISTHSGDASSSDQGHVDEEDDNEWRFSKSHHFSTFTQDDSEINPFERVLSPYFDILRGQSFSEPNTIPPSPARDSTGVPVDIGTTTEEDRSRSTLLGVPRGLGRAKGPREMRPPVPLLVHPRQSLGSRPPSLSMSLSSDDDERNSVLVKGREEVDDSESMMEVFLDRDSAAFSAVLTFLRDGHLPLSHALPSSDSENTKSPNVDPTTLSLYRLHPPSALTLLASLRALRMEAMWLGLTDLLEVCEKEREKVIEMVRWIEEEKRLDREEDERKRRADIMKGREKAGWI